MLLSIIVPCYNAAEDIEALFERVAPQLGPDTELVFINDGSSDQTAAVIERLVARYRGDGAVILETTPNAGAAAARTRGIAKARGRFIGFSDSDDLIDAGFVETFRRYLATYPAMDLMFFSSVIRVSTNLGSERIVPKLRYDRCHQFATGQDLLQFNLSNGMFTAAVWTFIASRELVLSAGSVFTDRRAHEDHLFTLRTIMKASCIIAAPEVLYAQKLRIGSLTNSKKDLGYLVDRISAYFEASDYLKTEHVDTRLYDRWSSQAIIGMLNDNRRLLGSLLLTRDGQRFVARHAGDLAAEFTSRLRRKMARRP